MLAKCKIKRFTETSQKKNKKLEKKVQKQSNWNNKCNNKNSLKKLHILI